MNFLKLPQELVDLILSYENIYRINYNKVIRELLFINYRYTMWIWSKFLYSNQSFSEYALKIDLRKKHINNADWKQLN